MASQKLWYLVTYDVRDPKRLAKTAKKIEGYGQRIQYSVFRCRLSDREREKLRWDLSKILENEDDLLIIGLCERCAAKVRVKSEDKSWGEKPVSFEIV